MHLKFLKPLNTEKEKLLYKKNQELISKNTELLEYLDLLSEDLKNEISIRDLIDSLGESLDLEETLTIIVNNLTELTKTAKCIIYLVDPKNTKARTYNEFRSREDIGLSSENLELYCLLDDFYVKKAEDNTPILIEHFNYNLMNYTQKKYLDYYKVKSLIITPINYKKELLGLILLHQSDFFCDWYDSHAELLKKYSYQAATSIKHAILYDRHRLQAEHKNNTIKNMPIKLRTQITSIIGYSELLLSQQQDQLTDKQKEYLTNIGKSAEILNKSIYDMFRIP